MISVRELFVMVYASVWCIYLIQGAGAALLGRSGTQTFSGVPFCVGNICYNKKFSRPPAILFFSNPSTSVSVDDFLPQNSTSLSYNVQTLSQFQQLSASQFLQSTNQPTFLCINCNISSNISDTDSQLSSDANYPFTASLNTVGPTGCCITSPMSCPGNLTENNAGWNNKTVPPLDFLLAASIAGSDFIVVPISFPEVSSVSLPLALSTSSVPCLQMFLPSLETFANLVGDENIKCHMPLYRKKVIIFLIEECRRQLRTADMSQLKNNMTTSITCNAPSGAKKNRMALKFSLADIETANKAHLISTISNEFRVSLRNFCIQNCAKADLPTDTCNLFDVRIILLKRPSRDVRNIQFYATENGTYDGSSSQIREIFSTIINNMYTSEQLFPDLSNDTLASITFSKVFNTAIHVLLREKEMYTNHMDATSNDPLIIKERNKKQYGTLHRLVDQKFCHFPSVHYHSLPYYVCSNWDFWNKSISFRQIDSVKNEMLKEYYISLREANSTFRELSEKWQPETREQQQQIHETRNTNLPESGIVTQCDNFYKKAEELLKLYTNLYISKTFKYSRKNSKSACRGHNEGSYNENGRLEADELWRYRISKGIELWNEMWHPILEQYKAHLLVLKEICFDNFRQKIFTQLTDSDEKYNRRNGASNIEDIKPLFVNFRRANKRFERMVEENVKNKARNLLKILKCFLLLLDNCEIEREEKEIAKLIQLYKFVQRDLEEKMHDAMFNLAIQLGTSRAVAIFSKTEKMKHVYRRPWIDFWPGCEEDHDIYQTKLDSSTCNIKNKFDAVLRGLRTIRNLFGILNLNFHYLSPNAFGFSNRFFSPSDISNCLLAPIDAPHPPHKTLTLHPLHT